MLRHRLVAISAVLGLVFANTVRAELPWQFDQHTRYMALGDSLSAGYGAVPATQGFTYLLYQGGVFDTMPNTLFANAAVSGVTSQQVLEYQVPQATDAFYPQVITLTVGGNDLLKILSGANPYVVLAEFEINLRVIMEKLKAGLPQTKIIIGNLYTIPEIPGANETVPAFNAIVARVAADYGVRVADVYNAFLDRNGLLLIDRHGADVYQVHPTNAGYRVMAKAFEAAAK